MRVKTENDLNCILQIRRTENQLIFTCTNNRSRFFCSLLISSIVTVASYISLSYKSHIVVSRSIQDYKLINKIKFREVNCYLTFCMSAWMLLSIGFNVHLISWIQINVFNDFDRRLLYFCSKKIYMSTIIDNRFNAC